MCLINFQFHDHPNYKLIVAANRDEFYQRPTEQAHFWEDEVDILAGRDLLQMGTWLGITRQGRFAALTNFRAPKHMKHATDKISRGDIVKGYLSENVTPEAYLSSLSENKSAFAGFNVIAGNPDQLFYYNNIQDEVVEIAAGTHGLSNHFLDTPWPKVTKGNRLLREYTAEQENIQPEKLFEIVSDAEQAEDEYLPQTGVGIDLERMLSPLFIKMPDYGTRSSTVLLIDKTNHVTFVERTYDKGVFKRENRFEFQIG